MLHSLWRIVRIGIATALLIAAAGWVAGRARFGASDQTAIARIERELGQRIAASADTLGRMTTQLISDRAGLESAARVQPSARRLFDVVGAALPSEQAGRLGITVYDAADAPIAWAGRTSELAKTQLDGSSALFVAIGGQGARLVRVEP